ncbi:MAG TPA: HlyD family secretion protein [Terriglobales bacterium]|jgi:membrane fusion protein (multidrug efflux system)
MAPRESNVVAETPEETRAQRLHEDASEHRDVAPPRKQSLFQRKPWLKPVMWIVLLLLVAGAVLYWLHARQYEDTDDAQIDGHINNISARITGHVTKVNFDDNQPVKAGDVLVEIDPADYEVAVARAEADYRDQLGQAQAALSSVPIARAGSSSSIATAQADVSNANAAVLAAKRQADAARAQLEQAQANANKANADVKRYQQLVAKQEISQQQFDQAQATAQSSNAAVTAAQANIAAAEQQVNVAQGRLLQAQANLTNAKVSPANVQATSQKASAAGAAAKRTEAALNQAKLNLQYTKIISPTDGVVGHRSVEVGQNVSPGQLMMSVVPLNDLYVTANFKETQLHFMRVGQPASIHVDAIDKDIDGKVDSIGAATGAVFSMLPPENATGNYVKVVQRVPVKITFDPNQDPEHRLRPGMSVEATVKVR